MNEFKEVLSDNTDFFQSSYQTVLTIQESSYQTIVRIFSEFIPKIADTLGELISINDMRFPESRYIANTDIFNIYLLTNDLVVIALDSQSRGPGCKTAELPQGQLSLSSFRGQLNEYR